jgi:RNA polymerase sigma factor (sigma-70 family)
MATAPQELLDLLQATQAEAREAAWARFVTRFSPLLLHTARTVAHEHDRAMDAYAYLLEQLHQDDARRLRRYAEEPRAQFTTWLVVVCRRLCIDFLRQRYGRLEQVAPPGAAPQVVRRRLAELVAKQLDRAGPMPDPALGADEELRRRDLTAALQTCLDRLPPAQRLLLAMRFEDDLPVREIAKLLRYRSPFHVYRTLTSILAELRLGLRRLGVRDPQP